MRWNVICHSVRMSRELKCYFLAYLWRGRASFSADSDAAATAWQSAAASDCWVIALNSLTNTTTTCIHWHSQPVAFLFIPLPGNPFCLNATKTSRYLRRARTQTSHADTGHHHSVWLRQSLQCMAIEQDHWVYPKDWWWPIDIPTDQMTDVYCGLIAAAAAATYRSRRVHIQIYIAIHVLVARSTNNPTERSTYGALHAAAPALNHPVRVYFPSLSATPEHTL